jgi:hypothetical protein
MNAKCLIVLISLAAFSLIGCQNKQTKAQDELKKLEAEYAPLQERYNQDCLTGSPDHIAANRSLCEQERKQTADLDQRIAVLRQQAMQQ